ncbi:MAG: hypothetical protein IT304_08815 [Dehalococcoidia bacterium]|nr:hypothetical protein [Dehalococcoidia bacterium]
MQREQCGAPTRKGPPCRFARGECPHHRRVGPAPAAAGEGLAVPPAVGLRDLRGTGWWVIAQTISGELAPPRASVVVSTIRTLAALGPGDLDEEEALREVELRARLMHGLAPRTPAEWERAGSLFATETLSELHRWTPPALP